MCVYLSVLEEIVKEVVDDISSEYLDSNAVGHFLRFSLHSHIKRKNNGPPGGGGRGTEEGGREGGGGRDGGGWREVEGGREEQIEGREGEGRGVRIGTILL